MRWMRDKRGMVGAAVLALAGTGGTGHGQDNELPPITLDQMAQRLADLEKQNQTLQGRVNELESVDGETWISEQRAEEIRGIVTDVLADADSRVGFQSAGLTAGWDDGFFLQSPDGRFRLNIGGMTQARYVYSHFREPFDASNTPGPSEPTSFQAEDNAIRRYGWDMPYTRLDFDGHMFGPGTTFRIMGGFANMRSQFFTVNAGSQPFVASSEYGARNGQFQLLDAWIAHALDSNFTVKVGQFKLPFDRAWEVGIPNQLTGERTAVALHMGLGRSQGIELGYQSDDVRVGVAVSEGGNDRLFEQYRLAVTEPINTPYYDTQSEISFSGRVEYKVAGAWSDFDQMTSPPGEEFGLLVGAGFHYQRGKVNINPTGINNTNNGLGNNYNSWVGLTGDVTANLGGASITANVYYHNVDSGASYLIYNFPAIGRDNPTLDVGTVQMMGASIFGSMYVTPEAELYLGAEWMSMIGGNRLDSLENLPTGATPFYSAYADPHAYLGLHFGSTYYIDGEDLKIGASVTYFPTQVSPNWNTPELGVRSTPSSDQYILRGYVQLAF